MSEQHRSVGRPPNRLNLRTRDRIVEWLEQRRMETLLPPTVREIADGGRPGLHRQHRLSPEQSA